MCSAGSYNWKSFMKRKIHYRQINVCAFEYPRDIPTSVLPWLLILLTEDWIHYSASTSQSWTVVINLCQGQTLTWGTYWILSVFFPQFLTVYNVLSVILFKVWTTIKTWISSTLKWNDMRCGWKENNLEKQKEICERSANTLKYVSAVHYL